NGTRIKWEQEQPYVISSQEDMLKYVSQKEFSIGYVSFQSLFDMNNHDNYLQHIQIAQIVQSAHDKKENHTHKHTFTSSTPSWESIQRSFDTWYREMMNEDEILSRTPF